MTSAFSAAVLLLPFEPGALPQAGGGCSAFAPKHRPESVNPQPSWRSPHFEIAPLALRAALDLIQKFR